jgi:uncharacterized protein YbjT (DUF2867 family)
VAYVLSSTATPPEGLEVHMHVITGITGQVGGQAAMALLDAGRRVRAVVRSEEKGAAWRARGCEVAVVPTAADEDALATAFTGATGVFLLNPPNYDPKPGFPDTLEVAEAYFRAIESARPGRVVFLSSVGARANKFNLLNNAGIMERRLRETNLPLALLRPAWFMENFAWDIPSARKGRIETYLQPLDRAVDMVSVQDIGRVVAELLTETWEGTRVVELAGPENVSPLAVARKLTALLDHPVEVAAVPRESWEARFRAEGMMRPEARIQMLDGFNQGWIKFEVADAERRTGRVRVGHVLCDLVASR